MQWEENLNSDNDNVQNSCEKRVVDVQKKHLVHLQRQRGAPLCAAGNECVI